MARQTPLTSFIKRPRSIRLALAELLCGRVSARLAELEDRVIALEQRCDAQAFAISNLGTIVAVEKARKSVTSRILRQHQADMESSHGKLSTQTTETNGLRTHSGVSGSGSRTSRSESADTGTRQSSHFNHRDTRIPSDLSASEAQPFCLSGWNDGGQHSATSSCD
ncbi:hypothetical protein HVX64_23810 (plasmid) [Citrobacter sp. RHB20-C16]|uniref:Uncharacterized protein n=1 Tax=Citrobacter amalonaticus TaxID=35703 RepID=A0ABY0HVG8_CITAM|nr:MULTISPECIES: hypothetical protein [Citrobacter]MZK91504.1 hypothetical protein [Citrobacter amalonaticus]MZK96059.1 hypothetical protein [Citrobacter amalonaticus]MZL05672.1 hypothetical protein [Citrobacter amalonaticus]MZL15919.1 hypothetical protein [Citrobacter amalonaticus]MZL25700.1 hypothetical protein [Citrobacter amalonaticus]